MHLCFQKYLFQDAHVGNGSQGSGIDCNEEAIRGPLSKNARQNTLELAEASEIPKSTVHYNNVWIPHILTEKHFLTRVTACVSLLSRHKELSFLNRIVTGDEKWISYNNVVQKEAGHCHVNLIKLSGSLDFILRRLCCPFGGIVELL